MFARAAVCGRVPKGAVAGLYEPFRRWSNRRLGYNATQQVLLTSVGAGAVSTMVGCASPSLSECDPFLTRALAILGNPLFLVKTRMQAYSPVLPVGAQRYYRHAWDAFSTIVREDGMKGLLRGWDAAILRGAIGGSVYAPSCECMCPN